MIYADNAATTRISDTALAKMLPFLQVQYGNASSQYSLGVAAKRAIERARHQVATAIGALSEEITFTSGGSESNSWIFSGFVKLFCNTPSHVITTSIEHHSVLNSANDLKAVGIEVTFLPVDNGGRISITDVIDSIRPNTKLVSIMLANNEIGTLQPVTEVGRILRKRDILFHTDAVQAVGHIPIDVNDLRVDFLTASAHKFNGPKGTGILYIRSGKQLPQMIFGGEQERGNRPGTENVAGIVAAGYALEESVSDMDSKAAILRSFAVATVKGIQAQIPDSRVNGDTEHSLPGIVNIGFDGVSGESLMNILDLKGICVSTSSACTSGNDEPSHVLMALGLSETQAKSAIRISYGINNTESDVETIVAEVCKAYFKIAEA